MRKISIVYPYYNNAGMLGYQINLWQQYPAEIKQALEFIVVDDGSPRLPALQEFDYYELGLDFHLYLIEKDIPWNQGGAHNLGVDRATNDWVFVGDIDHAIPEAAMIKMLALPFRSGEYYTFARQKVKSLKPFRASVRPSSTNIYLIEQAAYFKAGAYDEDFSGNYGYENAWARLGRQKILTEVYVPDVVLDCFTYDLVVDANDMSRPRDKAVNLKLYNDKMAGRVPPSNKFFRFPWRPIL